MIWRLEYENAHGDVARLDIQRDAATPVEIIEGTENPFLLSYELEGKNKKGFIMSSFADISVYETPTFNIDDLKTSNETELSVKWYINSVLTWSGFVVPDFFSREIGEPAIVNLAASDRLSALKDSTLDGLTGYINMKDLLEACLEQTGLELPLAYTVDFKTKINGATIDFMYVVASAERLQDDKGRRFSCYDILRSILVLSNSTIRQRDGSWKLINKIQHEAVSPQLTFNEVYAGAKRTIQPVFSSVGAFHEFGGGKRYPINNDFQLATGWTPKNGFSYIRENREILGYEIEYVGPYEVVVAIPIYGAVTNNYQLFNRNNLDFYPELNLETSPYLESSIDLIPYDSTSIGIECILTATGLNSYELDSPFMVHFAVIAESDTKKLILNNDGVFVPFSNNKDNLLGMTFSRDKDAASQMETKSATFKGKLTDDTNVNDYKISIRIYGKSVSQPTFIDSIYYKFKSDEDVGKGMLYRTEQIGVFSKKNDPETTIFGDYISNGLNGYFYPYPSEDTSILRSPVDTDLHSRLWTTATDPASGELPILQHVARQNSRMFGVAHNILSAVIDAKTFDPLSNVSNCAGEKYVVVAATFDFLRSTVEVELQQIAYGTLERRDFIYNYFGGQDDGIRSIGAASSGGTSIGGGGSFLDKYFTFDEGNDALIANVNLVSEKELAAYFGGGDFPSFWDDLPVATATTLGGVKVSPGSGLVMNGEQLEIDGDTFNLTNYYTKAQTDSLLSGKFDKAGGSITGNVSIGGNLTVLGTEFFADVQTVRITDNLAVINYGETGAGVTAGFSGWEIDRGTATHYRFGYSESPGYFQVGKVGDLQTVATREDVPLSNGFAQWNATLKRFDTVVINNIVTGTGTAGQISYWNGTGSQAGSSNLIWDNANGILSSLKVAIGKTTVTSGYKLDVNGAIRAAGNIYATGNITGAGEVTAYTASDARLKANITSLASINALDIINQLNPVTYTWNSKAVRLNPNKNTTSINYGIIAQELEQIVPDLIRPIYGDYKTYDDRGLMTIMLQAIKELKAEVDLLKNKN